MTGENNPYLPVQSEHIAKRHKKFQVVVPMYKNPIGN